MRASRIVRSIRSQSWRTQSTHLSRPKATHDYRVCAAALLTRQQESGQKSWDTMSGFGAVAALSLAVLGSSVASTDEKKTEDSTEDLPTYRMADVAKRDGIHSKEVWVTYGGAVYDVTEFVMNHPGGSSKIMLAAGKALEPFWQLFPFHTHLQLPQQLLKDMQIGLLDARDQIQADKDYNDPFSQDPPRHPALKIHSDKPCNAEVPESLLTESWVTPSTLFYVRHHHHVPLVENAEENFRMTVDLSELRGLKKKSKIASFTLADLRKLPQHTITATMQCSGNRRADMSLFKKTSGTYWGQGAISTATWTGPRLRDVLLAAGVTRDELDEIDDSSVNHVCFEGLDSMQASITAERAMDRKADVILALKMNDETLPREHGYPVRAVVPGVVGVRQVKWVQNVNLSSEEAVGDWQRGLNYKIIPPNVKDVNSVNLKDIPAMQEASVFSGITFLEQTYPSDLDLSSFPGITLGDGESLAYVDAKGWAWAGGGRGIARVDVTGDAGQSWTPGQLEEGKDQKLGREWAWVFWTAENVRVIRKKDGTCEVASRAVDKAYNSQPEDVESIWNVRGLGNNAWFRKHAPLDDD